MSSTRLRNAPCEYKRQQDEKFKAYNYVNNHNKLHHPNTTFPKFGVNMGNMPADVLSSNFADVDSFLKGTYFNNLEKPKENFTAKIQEIGCSEFFKKPELIMPENLQIDKNRPVIFRR